MNSVGTGHVQDRNSAVIVFWSEFPEQFVEDDRCVYIHGSRLREWLGEHPQRLDREQVADIATAVERI
jgi:hypothetical protein